MAHITLSFGSPGIVGLMQQFPQAAKALNGLAEALLRGPSPLTPAERELIAAHVSRRNECHFCASSHAAAAKHLLEPPLQHLAEAVQRDAAHPDLSAKMQALLTIAGKVQQSGKRVTAEDADAARAAGATDHDIHDAVLIAAAFCMFNRYVDGLGTWAPEPAAAYDEMGAMLASQGYLNAIS
jgi:uncharacterized peroxidase-related enzyme